MNEHQQYLASLIVTPEYVAAMSAALAGRIRSLTEQVRAAVRNGDPTRAALAEGQLYATENILGTVQSYVKSGASNGSR